MLIVSNNKLELNPETVRQAIEFWLNSQVFKSPVTVIVVTVGMSNPTPLTVEFQNGVENEHRD